MSYFYFIFLFHSPRLIDMGKVYRQTNLENLEQAFGVAERDLGVTRLLDPEGNRGGRPFQHKEESLWLNAVKHDVPLTF